MSTKLNAEELAAKRFPARSEDGEVEYGPSWREAAKVIIREVAQPIADERDELREALTDLHDVAIDARAIVAGQQTPIDRSALIILLTERLAATRAILDKYPTP